jgi:hypothetical protein
MGERNRAGIYLSHQISGMRLEEIGAHFGMKGSAVSQLSRRSQERIKGDKELRGILDKIKRGGLLNVYSSTTAFITKVPVLRLHRSSSQ